MLEFVFKKSDLTKLIDASGSPADGDVVAKLDFDHGTGGGFVALVTAHCEDGKGVVQGGEINGCPRPPGCD